jgi:hypothetical protein
VVRALISRISSVRAGLKSVIGIDLRQSSLRRPKNKFGGTHGKSNESRSGGAGRCWPGDRRGRGVCGRRKEIGSFHIGGESLTLQGLPVKELVYTAGGPPTKMDPNGDFHTGQMYVGYVKLANPKRCCYGTAAG